MADVFSKEKRSAIMSRIRSKNTKPEMVIRTVLFSKGFRYRLHDGKLPGKPDLVLKKYNAVIFVHGCFWHGHNDCKYHVIPSTNRSFWKNKITNNQNKDVANVKKLKEMGWRVFCVWECDLKKAKIQYTVIKMLKFLADAK